MELCHQLVEALGKRLITLVTLVIGSLVQIQSLAMGWPVAIAYGQLLMLLAQLSLARL